LHLLFIRPKSSFGEREVAAKEHGIPEDPTHRITCCDYLLYHLAGSMLPKRRFWNEEPKMKLGFSKHFSMDNGPNRVLTPLLISSLVPRSKIFFWVG
jgi:hypothetical protein